MKRSGQSDSGGGGSNMVEMGYSESFSFISEPAAAATEVNPIPVHGPKNMKKRRIRMPSPIMFGDNDKVKHETMYKKCLRSTHMEATGAGHSSGDKASIKDEDEEQNFEPIDSFADLANDRPRQPLSSFPTFMCKLFGCKKLHDPEIVETEIKPATPKSILRTPSGSGGNESSAEVKICRDQNGRKSVTFRPSFFCELCEIASCNPFEFTQHMQEIHCHIPKVLHQISLPKMKHHVHEVQDQDSPGQNRILRTRKRTSRKNDERDFATDGLVPTVDGVDSQAASQREYEYEYDILLGNSPRISATESGNADMENDDVKLNNLASAFDTFTINPLVDPVLEDKYTNLTFNESAYGDSSLQYNVQSRHENGVESKNLIQSIETVLSVNTTLDSESKRYKLPRCICSKCNNSVTQKYYKNHIKICGRMKRQTVSKTGPGTLQDNTSYSFMSTSVLPEIENQNTSPVAFATLNCTEPLLGESSKTFKSPRQKCKLCSKEYAKSYLKYHMALCKINAVASTSEGYLPSGGIEIDLNTTFTAEPLSIEGTAETTEKGLRLKGRQPENALGTESATLSSFYQQDNRNGDAASVETNPLLHHPNTPCEYSVHYIKYHMKVSHHQPLEENHCTQTQSPSPTQEDLISNQTLSCETVVVKTPNQTNQVTDSKLFSNQTANTKSGQIQLNNTNTNSMKKPTFCTYNPKSFNRNVVSPPDCSFNFETSGRISSHFNKSSSDSALTHHDTSKRDDHVLKFRRKMD